MHKLGNEEDAGLTKVIVDSTVCFGSVFVPSNSVEVVWMNDSSNRRPYPGDFTG